MAGNVVGQEMEFQEGFRYDSSLPIGPNCLQCDRLISMKTRKVHGGIPINISSSNKDEGILASASSRPKGFRLNLRKLGNQSQAMSQVEKENLSDVLDVLLKYSKISNDSSCPYIQGKIPKNHKLYQNNFQWTLVKPKSSFRQ